MVEWNSSTGGRSLLRLSGISGMEWWNGIVEWNAGMAENLTFGGAMSYTAPQWK